MHSEGHFSIRNYLCRQYNTNVCKCTSIAYLNCHNTLLSHFRLAFFYSLSSNDEQYLLFLFVFFACIVSPFFICYHTHHLNRFWLKPRVHSKWWRWSTESERMCLQTCNSCLHLKHTQILSYAIRIQTVNQLKRLLNVIACVLCVLLANWESKSQHSTRNWAETIGMHLGVHGVLMKPVLAVAKIKYQSNRRKLARGSKWKQKNCIYTIERFVEERK